jgi:8-oxo-dGTP pyrophosphatase MutT (NUDIX family)
MTDAVVRGEIREEVLGISGWDAVEVGHRADVLAWLDSGVEVFRLRKPDVPAKHLVAYFVVVDPERRSLLLGDHIDAQLWLPTGGHVEPGEHPRRTVVREAREELGIDAEFLGDDPRPLFVTVTETGGISAGHTDVSLWYLVRGDAGADAHDLVFDPAEFNAIGWFTFDEVLATDPARFDPHMHRFTAKLLHHLDT